MKVIFTNVNPHKKWNKERGILIKLQIDNCLNNMGWKLEDIVLATNFEYEYRGVKAIVVPDDLYVGFDDKRYSFKVSTHIMIINYLLQHDLIEKGTLYWYHDMDAYQQELVTEEELGLDGLDLGLTNYGWSKKWNLGSFFFRESAKDIFALLAHTIMEKQLGDERSFRGLWEEGKINHARCKLLNITYNFGMKNLKVMYEMADKPLKVLHFHPCYKDATLPESTLSMFMYGKNELGMVLMKPALIELFKKYGFEAPYGMNISYNDFLRSIEYE